MKGIRVRILKRFKSLQPFQSPERFSFQTSQNHSSYKDHDHRSWEEDFDSRLQASRKGHIEVNNRIPVKDVIDYGHSVALGEAEDLFQECDEEAFHDSHHEVEFSQQMNGDCPDLLSFEQKCPPGGSNSVILYTTSMRGIRKTFEDCHSIKFLLDSFRIVYQERDVSMDLGFREELWEILGDRIIPPRLFIRGRLIGGADEVETLHECGKLKILLQGIPVVPCNQRCRGCNGVRFVVCCCCNGSRKVFHGEGKDGSFSRCSRCNENGLVKCPLCS